jgi:hypothetical protein
MSYTLPQSLLVKPQVHKKLKGDLIMSFGGGILREESYRPVGLNALWTLVGAVASLEEPFFVEIKEGMTMAGYMVGFENGLFCFFSWEKVGIDVYTLTAINPEAAAKVTVNDVRHGIFAWVPNCAMTSFDDVLKIGNSVLLSENLHFRTNIAQGFANWENDHYKTTSP